MKAGASHASHGEDAARTGAGGAHSFGGYGGSLRTRGGSSRRGAAPEIGGAARSSSQSQPGGGGGGGRGPLLRGKYGRGRSLRNCPRGGGGLFFRPCGRDGPFADGRSGRRGARYPAGKRGGLRKGKLLRFPRGEHVVPVGGKLPGGGGEEGAPPPEIGEVAGAQHRHGDGGPKGRPGEEPAGRRKEAGGRQREAGRRIERRRRGGRKSAGRAGRPARSRPPPSRRRRRGGEARPKGSRIRAGARPRSPGREAACWRRI